MKIINKKVIYILNESEIHFELQIPKNTKTMRNDLFGTLFYVVNLSMQLATKYNDNLPLL